MFEVGFSEMVVCFLVALLVLGPEKLPKLARTIGRWAGQAKGYLHNLSAELDRESEIGELKRQLEAAKRTMQQEAASFESGVRDTAQSVQDTVTPPAEQPPAHDQTPHKP